MERKKTGRSFTRLPREGSFPGKNNNTGGGEEKSGKRRAKKGRKSAKTPQRKRNTQKETGTNHYIPPTNFLIGTWRPKPPRRGGAGGSLLQMGQSKWKKQDEEKKN